MIYLFILVGFFVVSILIHYIQNGLNVKRDYNVSIFGGILVLSIFAFIIGYFFDFKYHLFFMGYGTLFFIGSLISLAVSYWYNHLS
ncbi:hypothetical protein [Aquisalibacillus elongatus]|uniref:YesK-like protein n=1 Tax=Aquisalibacillus elongatus TaxID=485577 RepID=A0A3N5C9C3_9BACI|nr:hypothetical protein [Aquisalibacillus elongatus]RPF53221.1 hypothetical protein EDC24_1718 [Aquisalibacillus elongatus]